MRQTASIISTYTADVSGVCSALFELGGMTVMHDASGCNSTYNTHDEPRWYDMDSMVFLSGLSEMEAIMGDDEKLISDIAAAANDLHPRFIAIAGTPIPMMIGSDFRAIAASVERKTGIPTMGFATNGMHTYARGAGMALEGFARRFLKRESVGADKKPHSVNILGLTPLDFSINGNADSIRRVLADNGFAVVSSWAMGSSFEQLMDSAQASANLVVASSGLPVAKYMYEAFGIPYVVGTPYGQFESNVINALSHAIQCGKNIMTYADIKACNDADTVIIGECIMSCSLAAALKSEFDIDARAISTVGTGTELLNCNAVMARDEYSLAPLLKDVRRVIADPLYRPICPADAEFISLSHEAFSGRIYRRDIPDMIGGKLFRFKK